MRTRLSRLLTLIVLVGSLVGCDRAAKLAASEHLLGEPPRTYANGVIRVQYAENRGAFLGLGDRLPERQRFWLLTVATGALLAVIGWMLVLRPEGGALRFTALALILGGGVGNLVDRALEGYVVDFVSVGIGEVRTGIFNVADVAITAGAVLLLLEWLRGERTPSPA